jgi:hypothetical protein
MFVAPLFLHKIFLPFLWHKNMLHCIFFHENLFRAPETQVLFYISGGYKKQQLNILFHVKRKKFNSLTPQEATLFFLIGHVQSVGIPHHFSSHTTERNDPNACVDDKSQPRHKDQAGEPNSGKPQCSTSKFNKRFYTRSKCQVVLVVSDKNNPFTVFAVNAITRNENALT